MAAANQPGSFDAVWETVRQWPTEDRRSLASQLLASLAADHAESAPKAKPADLIAAWRDAGPLTDDAVRTLVEEDLLRKHG